MKPSISQLVKSKYMTEAELIRLKINLIDDDIMRGYEYPTSDFDVRYLSDYIEIYEYGVNRRIDLFIPYYKLPYYYSRMGDVL